MLRRGIEQWEFHRWGRCRACEPSPELREPFATRQWLQQFKGDAMGMAEMRDLAARASGHSWRFDGMTDDEVIEQVADLLTSGSWHMHAPRRSSSFLTQAPSDEVQKAASQKTDAPANGSLARAAEKVRSLASLASSEPVREARTAPPVKPVSRALAPRPPAEPVERAPDITEPPSEEVQTHWIAFRILDDVTGVPVSGMTLTVRLPDGTEQQVTTDKEGFARVEDTVEGECQASCDLEDSKVTESFNFVRME